VAQSKLSPREMHGKKYAELLTIPEVREAYVARSRFEKLGAWIIPERLVRENSGTRHETAEPTLEEVSRLVDTATENVNRENVKP